MGCVIDHLQADYRVTVLRDFVDARGAAHHTGEAGVIRLLTLDWAKREISIYWDRNGAAETLIFDLDSRTGPGNGRMREYFERGGYEPEPRPAGLRREDIEDGPFAPVVQLALQEDFDAADRRLRALDDDTESTAEALTAAAVRNAANRAACDWLRQRATDYWYFWGSQATSGGDGASRLLVMRPALARLRQLEEER